MNQSELLEKVADLWDEAVEEDLVNQEDISFETFLGAHYAIGAVANRCQLTDDGIQLVEQALEELTQLLGGSDDDEDEDEDEDE